MKDLEHRVGLDCPYKSAQWSMEAQENMCMYDVTYEEYGKFKRYTNLSKAVFFVGLGLVKVSICFFNRRLTSLTSRTWTWLNNGFLALLFTYILLALFWTIFQCDPPYAGWDLIRVAREGKPLKCTSDNIVGSTLSVIHVSMEFALLSVPLIVLWKVKMSWGTKGRLYFVSSIGAMSCIGSVMRQIEQKNLTFNDILWNFIALANWTLIDLCFGVVAASLPILSAFIPKSWNSVRGTSKATDTPYTHVLSGTGPSGRDSKSESPSARETSARMHGKREDIDKDSTDYIVRTDVIELSYQNKSEFDQISRNSDVGSLRSQSNRGRDSSNTRSDSVYDAGEYQDRQVWIGQAR